MVPRAPELVGARGFLVVAGAIPIATKDNSGRMPTNAYKATGCEEITIQPNKVLKVIDLRSYSYSYIEFFAVETPTWSTKMPTKMAISLHSDTTAVENITWKRIYGTLNIKVYKHDNYLYLINKNTYATCCFITIRSSQIYNKDYPLEILDSLPEGATEITESA